MRLIAPLVVGLVVVAMASEAFARSRCGGRNRVRGIDVSKWQGAVDWKRVARAGVRFAFIRVSDGTNPTDPTFATNWQKARAARITRGAYQYFRPDQDPIEQADRLIAQMGPLRRGDLPPVLDLETSGGKTKRQVVARVRKWIKRVKSATGVDPIIYTNAKSWIEIAGNNRSWRRSPLWVAHFGVRCPMTPTAWRRWTFHQHSETGQVGGIRGAVDLNDFNGTRAQLRRLTVKSERKARARYRAWKRKRARERRRARR